MGDKDERDNNRQRIERASDNLYGALCTIAADTSAKAWLFACLDTLTNLARSSLEPSAPSATTGDQ